MQKSKKKLFFKIFAVILAVIIVFAGSFGGYVLYRFNCDKSNAQNSYEQVYNAPQINLQTDEDGIFITTTSLCDSKIIYKFGTYRVGYIPNYY